MHFFHPTNAVTALSWGGNQFQPDAAGVFDLPYEAMGDMRAFGMVAGEPTPQEPADISVPFSNWKNVDLLAKAVELGLELPPDIKRPDLIKAVGEALKLKVQD